MDTEIRWQDLVDQLEESVRPDYLRLNIPLQDTPYGIDTVDTMEEYRNRVILHPGAARKARETATALLVSRFFFQLQDLPNDTPSPFRAHGTIHCKGPSRQVLDALHCLHPQGLDYFTDSETIGRLTSSDELCPDCGRYTQPVSFSTTHFDQVVNIYVRAKSKQQWRISGFPDSMASVSIKQQLHAPFGRSTHGRPSVAPCGRCDGGTYVRGRRRKHSSARSQGERTKRTRCGDHQDQRSD